jgi:hypothetical protein
MLCDVALVVEYPCRDPRFSVKPKSTNEEDNSLVVKVIVAVE